MPRRRERIFGAHEALRAAAERSVPPYGTLEARRRALRAVCMLPRGTVHAHGVAARDSKTATRAEQALRELTAGGVPSGVALCHVHGCPEDAWGKREEERKRKRERESGRERVREREKGKREKKEKKRKEKRERERERETQNTFRET